MRTTIELPDELMTRAKVYAAGKGLSLKQLFTEAMEEKLSRTAGKTRRAPPAVGDPNAPKIGILTPEQIDEAMFG